MMNEYFRDPEVEPGIHNVILQNRCGNRLTILVHENSTDLEFVYKPNAFRRKEFRARNFSNRDNFTTIFASAELPEVGTCLSPQFDYDPFVTRIDTQSPSLARNAVTVVNVVDENVFAVAARAPLLLSFKPHERFDVTDGMLTESFSDRGEAIVSFVKFTSFEANRYRRLADGRHVLQLFENEVILIGAEESQYQADRALAALEGMDLRELVARNERALEAHLSVGRIEVKDETVQRVLDLNRRIVYSGIDEGGACFGALNRIYHLIWVRDGSMTTSHTAMAGVTAYARLWTPFLLANPSVIRAENGSVVREYLQAVGTRWTKAEDDGIYYAALSLFTLAQTAAERDLLHHDDFETLLRAIDRAIETRFDNRRALFGSDTRGESTLAGSPLFGYDAVNGKMDAHRVGTEQDGRQIAKAYSLYQNVNFYNVARMAATLLMQADRKQPERVARYNALAEQLAESLKSQFLQETGIYQADLLVYADGSEEWVDFKHADYWEYAWAVSQGPYHPDLTAALASARHVVQSWPIIRRYGYCPWNTLARFLKEYGLPSSEFDEMFRDEVRDAMVLTDKYPMRGALTEYQHDVNGWRALPFSAGSFILAHSAVLLQALPLGLAVRAGDSVDRVHGFRRGVSIIDVEATGTGDSVAHVTLNGHPLAHSLQLPEGRLRVGRNAVKITRGSNPRLARLYGSTASLYSITERDGLVIYEMNSAVDAQLIFEHVSAEMRIVVTGRAGEPVEPNRQQIENGRFTLLQVSVQGDFSVSLNSSAGDSSARIGSTTRSA
ncbi:MAG TPA: hypothetical protein VGN72_20320 [Tepidisphaeraceae bacterium]|jgi:hypothetical protein|nr:hypothetical protein [Tepidisphaeraceae bacterium]